MKGCELACAAAGGATQGAFPFVPLPLDACAMSAARRCLLHAYAATWLGLEPAPRSRAGNNEVGRGDARQPALAAVLPAAGENGAGRLAPESVSVKADAECLKPDAIGSWQVAFGTRLSS